MPRKFTKYCPTGYVVRRRYCTEPHWCRKHRLAVMKRREGRGTFTDSGARAWCGCRSRNGHYTVAHTRCIWTGPGGCDSPCAANAALRRQTIRRSADSADDRPPEYRSPEHRSPASSSSRRAQPDPMSSHWTLASSCGGRVAGSASHWHAVSCVVIAGDLHESGPSIGPVDRSLDSDAVRRRLPSIARNIGVAFPMTRGMRRQMTRFGCGRPVSARPTDHASSRPVVRGGPGDTATVSHDPGLASATLTSSGSTLMTTPPSVRWRLPGDGAGDNRGELPRESTGEAAATRGDGGVVSAARPGEFWQIDCTMDRRQLEADGWWYGDTLWAR